MILEEFNIDDKLIFTPDSFIQKSENCPDTAVAMFSDNFKEEFINIYNPSVYATLSCGHKFNVYKFNYNGKDMLFFQMPLGAPASVGVMEELSAMGVKNFLISGSCGVLSSQIEPYALIVPDKAIRDEGTSYHYSNSEDIVVLNGELVSRVENYLISSGLKCVRGTTWTTDAIYRETAEKAKRRIEKGAICVDMECSAMATFAKYKGVNFAQIFYGTDVVCEGEHDVRNLVNKDMNLETKILKIVIDCASKIF